MMWPTLALLALAGVDAPAAAPPSKAPDEALMDSDDEAVTRGFTRFRKTIPSSFQGVFRRSQAECGADSPTAITVRATRMNFADSEADVQRVRVDGTRKIVVTSIYDGGGEVWEKTETILLAKDGKGIAFQLDTGPYTRVRCSG
jgi:uncharacterized protein (DUF779 family)